ncbi:MAG TPA: hypothetical protein VIV56_07300 [Gemmatimonadales bacterium]
MTERHVIGGVPYVPVGTSTVEHDVWIMGRVHRAGLDEVLVHAGESPDEWGKRLLFEAMASGEALMLLAGLLVPEKVGAEGWTPEVAEQTAAAFGKLTADSDKEALYGLLLSTLIAFFETGLSSFVTTKTSS